ncbi:MAG: hypothetical protein WC682_04190 [Parcubacteria group bacterium]
MNRKPLNNISEIIARLRTSDGAKDFRERLRKNEILTEEELLKCYVFDRDTLRDHCDPVGD